MPDFYELLNVSSTASFEEIKCSYKQLILQCHPDKLRQLADLNPGSKSENSDFNAINAAWNTLKDPIKRKLYDAELLQSKFRAHSNIYASVELNEMQRILVEVEEDHDETSAPPPSAESEVEADKEPATVWSYAYDCRCGGQYLFDGPGDDESPEVIVECNECSLVIIVKQATTCK
ncbi:DPH4 homolog [Drosophila ficusphila]|uniref:DPH4 homolog n=1 Tax=Drosophila ficusphila TaxID=30025 RepID=UPI0007E719B0|nr:DPH4 homolog [Drosophila ficusphila]XP_017044122.1 DPH4 homolog [Drosophila ficusphila]XP_017044123.1 DPH4 homolog [Drosophila ficusphila]XP_017044124.1 DPH4 homolog [Drosophila ficusphila]XP_017044125.1 DPH4 homolog [Drosophila ficusphila]